MKNNKLMVMISIIALCANSNLNSDFDRDERFGAVVGDSAEYVDFENELGYAAKTSVYETLKQNDSLLTLGLSTDASFQQFYSNMSETNIGMLSEVQTAIDSNQIDTAAVINETVNDTNSIEYARKSVNAIITEKVLQNIPPTASDTATLEYVFNQHWINAGTAVYDAAAILGREYHSPVISLRLMNSETKLQEKALQKLQKFHLYPNPANTNVKISYTGSDNYLFELRDVYSRICLLDKNVKELNLTNYPSGVYNVSIFVNDVLQFKDKLIILK